jgi:hypothetical protein
VFDGAEAEEAVAISTVFVETPSRPTMVNPLNDVTTGATFCIDAAATPSVRPSVQPLQLRMEPFGWPCHAMFLKPWPGRRRTLSWLRWQVRIRSAPRMEFRRIWLFHDCFGVVSGDRPGADHASSVVLEHHQFAL